MSESASTPSSSSTGRADAPASAEGGSLPAGDDPLSPPEPPPEPEEPPSARTDAAVTVRLLLETGDTDPPLAGWLEPMLRRLAALAGVTGGELTVMAVDDAAMSAMHEQYAGVPGTTDVLTFDLTDAPASPETPAAPGSPGTPGTPATPASPDSTSVMGDIVICLDEAGRQARRRGHAMRLEALLYALHGLLHLLGEDDHDEAAYQRMHAREDALLQAVGLGAVFARHEGDR